MVFFKHPTAVVESDHIGDGTKIWHFAHVREGAKIGRNCIIGKSVYVDADVSIGNNVKIQNFVSIYKGVKIWDDVLIGPSVTFTNDLYPRAFSWSEDKIIPTAVKKGASIGANSTIVCGVTIGEYAMIGAGSVVTKDVPPFGLVYSNPGDLKGFVCYCGRKLEKVIKEEGDKIIYECSCGRDMEIEKEVVEMTGRHSKVENFGKKEKFIEVIYKDGVFRPLEEVNIEDGEKLRIKVERFDISKYFGVFGKASVEELIRIEEEVQI